MDKFLGIIFGLLILSLILLIHEAGHFVVGRKLGLKVVEFSIFMGPRIISWTKNDIRYSIKLIPLGASVEFAGEYDDKGEYIPKEGDFLSQPIWKRAWTMLAGPGFNIVAAILAFIILFSFTGHSTTQIAEVDANSLASISNMQAGEIIQKIGDYNINTDLDINIASMINDITKPYNIKTRTADGKDNEYTIIPQNKTVYKLGIIPTIDDNKNIIIYDIDTKLNPESNKFVLGDRIIEINDEKINIDNFYETIEKYTDKDNLKVTVLRGNSEIDLDLKLKAHEQPINLGIKLEKDNKWYNSFIYSFQYQWSYIKGTARVLGQVFSGSLPANEALTGPVGIVNTFSDVLIDSEINWGLKALNLLSLFAAISLALGVTNLIPLAPMDGGQLLLLVIEKIRGKRVSSKIENIIMLTGVVLLLILFVIALRFDLGRIFGF